MPSSPFSGYLHLLSTHPLATKMMTGATLAVAGDSLAQAREPNHDAYDKRRAVSLTRSLNPRSTMPQAPAEIHRKFREIRERQSRMSAPA